MNNFNFVTKKFFGRRRKVNLIQLLIQLLMDGTINQIKGDATKALIIVMKLKGLQKNHSSQY